MCSARLLRGAVAGTTPPRFLKNISHASPEPRYVLYTCIPIYVVYGASLLSIYCLWANRATCVLQGIHAPYVLVIKLISRISSFWFLVHRYEMYRMNSISNTKPHLALLRMLFCTFYINWKNSVFIYGSKSPIWKNHYQTKILYN